MRVNRLSQQPETPESRASFALTPHPALLVGLLMIVAACSAEKTSTTTFDAGVTTEDTATADTGAVDSGATTDDTMGADAGPGSTDSWIDSGGVVSENTNTLCNDGKDNDNDGKTDCDDLSCSTGIGVTVCDTTDPTKENTDPTCTDGKDNDNDGKTDCDDSDCKESTLVTVCDTKPGPTKEDNDAACQDGKDNDNNGYTDCNDFGCSKNPKVTVCGGTKPVCGNGKCESGETASNCAKDCSKPSALSCVGKCGQYDATAKCQCDDACVGEKDCCTDYKGVCGGSNSPVCGNGKCESGESKTSCPKDCDTKPAGSCKGKCGDFTPGASCQCDSGCVAIGDCCSDIKTVCGDVTAPSTSCLATPWQQQVKSVSPMPRVAADGKAVWLAANQLMYAAEPGAKLLAKPWTVKACAGSACSDQVVNAQGVAADPAGGVFAVGLFAEVTGASWSQGVVARYDASGKAVWSHNLLATGVAKTADLGTFSAVSAGPTGKAVVATAMKETGGVVARVWTVGSVGAALETTWKLSPGVAEVNSVAWDKDNIRAVGVAAGGGWLGGVTKGTSWQIALKGVTYAADVAMAEKGASYVVGHSTVSAGVASWLGRFDDAGKQVWVSKLGSGVQNRFDRVIGLPQGAALTGATLAKAGQWRAWLVAVDDKGIIQAQTSYGLPGVEVASTGAAMPDPEGVLLAARLGPVTKPTGVWLVRTDGNGDGPCSDAKGATCGAETVPCDDGQACTIDACDAKSGKCSHSPAGANAPCQDGNACTGAGICKAGACTAGTAVADGQPCGGSGTCKVGVCVGDKAVAPKVGDLVFSELMVRAKSGTGDDGEWIELTNVSKASIDLEGLALVYKGGTSVKLTGKGKPLTVKPGARFVIGRSTNAAKNFGAKIDYVQTQVAMSNSGATLDIKLGKVVIDAVKYTKSSVTLGVALQLSLSKIDAKSNDDIKSWCLATKGYGTSGLKGTPGTENLPCK